MTKKNRPDAVIVGAGFAGAVCARELAEKGQKVVVLEQRPQVGGNMYDGPDESGILTHWFGPHIFHTNNQVVFKWLDRFTEWIPYEHRVLGRIQDKEVPIPFNFTSIDTLFSTSEAKQLKQKLAQSFPKRQRITVLELVNHNDEELVQLGAFIFENVFVHYTAKQWGIPAEQVDTSVINRVPVLLSYDARYFQDDLQYMPKDGYTKLFEKILDHENISCRLNTAAETIVQLMPDGSVLFEDESFTEPIIYTGAPDQLLDYTHDRLAYRSLNLSFETLEQTKFQNAAVVNYPNEEKFTRITEFKQLTGQEVKGLTTILKEYPSIYTGAPGQEPYYPIENPANRKQYEMYRKELENWENLFLCGRLAQYKYYNMDQVIAEALQISAKILKQKGLPEMQKRVS